MPDLEATGTQSPKGWNQRRCVAAADRHDQRSAGKPLWHGCHEPRI